MPLQSSKNKENQNQRKKTPKTKIEKSNFYYVYLSKL